MPKKSACAEGAVAGGLAPKSNKEPPEAGAEGGCESNKPLPFVAPLLREAPPRISK